MKKWEKVAVDYCTGKQISPKAYTGQKLKAHWIKKCCDGFKSVTGTKMH